MKNLTYEETVKLSQALQSNSLEVVEPKFVFSTYMNPNTYELIQLNEYDANFFHPNYIKVSD